MASRWCVSLRSDIFPFRLLTVHATLGSSAGTLFPPNCTQDSNDIYAAMERGVAAIVADPRSKERIPVLVIDGPNVNIAMEEDAIIPSAVRLNII